MLWWCVSLAMAADEAAGNGFTMGEIWANSGGIARGVIITLAMMVLASIITAIDRTIAFNRARSQSIQLAAAIVGPLRQWDVTGAKKIASDEKFKASYLAATLRAGLTEIEARGDHHGVSSAERAVTRAQIEEIAKLKRGMTILATVASTAPFVGLFGTTFGVINAFSGMASGAGAGLAGISAGISEALITTAFGIGVAVIGVWMYNYFNGRADKVQEELLTSESDFIDWSEKLLLHRSEQAAASK